MYFSKILHGGKAPQYMLQNLAGSRDGCTEVIGCRFSMKNSMGDHVENKEIFYFFPFQIFLKATVGAGGKPCRLVGQ